MNTAISDLDTPVEGSTCCRTVGKSRAKHGKPRRVCGQSATVAVEWESEDGYRWWETYCGGCWQIVGAPFRVAA